MMLTRGDDLIRLERRRQTDAEGYSYRHDDEHTNDELVLAAVQYALPHLRRELITTVTSLPERFIGTPVDWPWENDAWKPTPDDRVRELVKAGALIAAEIDRLLRERDGK